MNRNRVLIVAAWLATAGMAAWAWQHVPAGSLVPVHWDLQGNVNRYGGKGEALLVCPILSAFVVGVLWLAAHFDPRKENVEQSRGALEAMALQIALFMAVIQGTLCWSATGHPVDIGRVVLGSVGLLFAGMGNLMGKLRSNRFAGFRTPWTLASERSWALTHRVGGRLFVLTGLGTAVAAVVGLPVLATVWLVAGLLFTLPYTFWYSHKVWKDDPDKVTP